MTFVPLGVFVSQCLSTPLTLPIYPPFEFHCLCFTLPIYPPFEFHCLCLTLPIYPPFEFHCLCFTVPIYPPLVLDCDWSILWISVAKPK